MAFRVISFGDKIKCGNYKLVSSFEKVRNFSFKKEFISLVTKDLCEGPDNIVFERLPPVSILTVRKKYILADKLKIKRPKKNYSSLAPKLIFDKKNEKKLLKALRAFLEYAPSFSMAFVFDEKKEIQFKTSFEKKMLNELKKGVALIKEKKIKKAVKKLSGLGFGLTPSGDDFLSGYVLGLKAVGNRNKELKDFIGAYNSKNLLCRRNFFNSSCGRVNFWIKDFMRFFMLKKEKSMKKVLKKAVSFGHSSGADFMAGFFFSLLS